MDASTYQLSKARIKELRVENYYKSYLLMGLNILMLAGGVVLFTSGNPLFYIAGVLLLSLQMLHAYLIVHETGHGSFFRKARRNEFYGNIFAFFAIMPFYSRRYEHAMHHRIAGSFEEPSTQRAMQRFNLINPRMVAFMSVCWKCWVPIFALNEHVMLWGLPFKEGMPSKTRIGTQISIGCYLLSLGTLLAFVPHAGLWLLKFLPAAYIYMMWIEFFNLPHHLASPIEDRKGPVPYYEQAQYTHSCSPMPEPIGPWLLLNFNYHIAHHLYPAVHWSKVKEAHNIMVEFDPTLGDAMSELKANRDMRRRPILDVLSKYFDHQNKTAQG